MIAAALEMESRRFPNLSVDGRQRARRASRNQ
jgi:hypothetical protein